MVGGKHHAANLSPDEYELPTHTVDTPQFAHIINSWSLFSLRRYIFAALSLYLDVINFFLFILQLVGGGRR